MPHRSRQLIAFWAAIGLAICTGPVASADSRASMARVDQEIRVSIGPDAIEIEYDTVLNRPAAFLEVVRMDADQDGKMSPAEQAHYFSSLGETLAAGIELSVNERQVSLKPAGKVKLTMPFTKTYRFTVPHPDQWADGARVEFHNDNYLSLPGTVKIVLDPGRGADITHHHIAGKALGDSGFTDLSEAQERDIVFRYRKGDGTLAEDATAQATARTQDAPPPSNNRIWIAILSSLAALTAIGFIGPRKRPIIACLTLLAVAGALCAADSSDPALIPDNARAIEIFRDLHTGIYRAFNGRTEDEIYDTLAASLEGQLLDDVYNEVHQTVAMRTNKQMSFRVRRVKSISTEVTPKSEAAFEVRHHWRVYGTVTHMAHSHARFNEYQAIYTVSHTAAGWRISESTICRHKRVSIGQS